MYEDKKRINLKHVHTGIIGPQQTTSKMLNCQLETEQLHLKFVYQIIIITRQLKEVEEVEGEGVAQKILVVYEEKVVQAPQVLGETGVLLY